MTLYTEGGKGQWGHLRTGFILDWGERESETEGLGTHMVLCCTCLWLEGGLAV